MMSEDFHGAKVALFVGEKLLVIRRDDFPTIPWPNYWDFPGGGREEEETPAQTVIRETQEEVALDLRESDIVWARAYQSWVAPDMQSWFLVARIGADRVAEIRLGDEGQEWALMDVETYARDPLHIPHFLDRLRDYLDARNPI